MAYTKIQIEAGKNSLLASGQPDKINALKHRQFEQMLIDEIYDHQSRGDLLALLDEVLSLMGSDKVVLIRNGVAKIVDISLLGGGSHWRGAYDASSNVFPEDGEGSGESGALVSGDEWYVSVAGQLNGEPAHIGTLIKYLAPGLWKITY